MSRHYLFGTLLTHYGSASLNHGKRKGNTSPLQKAKWNNKIHSVVNSDTIRWALRYYWQQNGYPVNRNWDGDNFINYWIDEQFNPEKFIDDDVFGYMRAEALKREVAKDTNQQNKDLAKKENNSTQTSRVRLK